MWKCSQCGADNKEQDRFCTVCGTRRGTQGPGKYRQKKSPLPWILGAGIGVLLVVVAVLAVLLLRKEPAQPTAHSGQPGRKEQLQEETLPADPQPTPEADPEADPVAQLLAQANQGEWTLVENGYWVLSIELPGTWETGEAVWNHGDLTVPVLGTDGKPLFTLEILECSSPVGTLEDDYVCRVLMGNNTWYQFFLVTDPAVPEESRQALADFVTSAIAPTTNFQTTDSAGRVLEITDEPRISHCAALLEDLTDPIMIHGTNVPGAQPFTMEVPGSWLQWPFEVRAIPGVGTSQVQVFDEKSSDLVLDLILDASGADREGYDYLGTLTMPDGARLKVLWKLPEAITDRERDQLRDYLAETALPTFHWIVEEVKSPYLLPTSDRTYLKAEDLYDLNHEELCFARNEIYARHGWIFSTRELREYFEAQSWYVGTVEGARFNRGVLNDYEVHNINLITDCEDQWYGGSYY